MKKRQHHFIYLFVLFAAMSFIAGLPSVNAQAAEYTASLAVDRPAGECRYTVQGIDVTQTSSLKLQASHKTSQAVALQKEIPITGENCVNGTYTGSFSLEDLNRSYDYYDVSITIGGSVINAGTCDFSVHNETLSASIEGGTSSRTRTLKIASSDTSGNVMIPGPNKSVSVMAWREGSEESTANTIAPAAPYNEGGMNISINTALAGTAYGNWTAKLVLENEKEGTKLTLAIATYSVQPTLKTFEVKKSKSLEKKKSFAVSVSGLQNVYGVKKLSFTVYNSKKKRIATISGTKKKSDGSKFYAEVSLKKLNYVLDTYTIQATLTDQNNRTQLLDATVLAEEEADGGSLSVIKKKNASCVYKLSNAYIPGNIKKMRFVVYGIDGKKEKKLNTYKVGSSTGKTVSVKAPNPDRGKYKVVVFGYTAWGKKIQLNEKTYQLRKKDMGKNGWYYEKYNGKKYKFYYIDNEKQTDLTDILNLKESSSTNTNRMYIEINRAACTVTIYLYNEETKKYDIPIKTCTVCVGSDVGTVAGAGGLNPKSYYTPIGTYSICTNGTSVKYTVKEMHEPDGKILYARWSSHIVGNVYFHAIAVGSDSHYALPSYRYNLLGSPASAGCIRMTVADAKWIYDYASTGTPVKIVKGDSSKPGPLGKLKTIKTTGSINYDPTDPAVPDSRKKADYKAKRISGYVTKSGKKIGQ